MTNRLADAMLRTKASGSMMYLHPRTAYLSNALLILASCADSDVVAAAATIHHLIARGRPSLLAEAAALLDRGSQMEWVEETIQSDDYGHERNLSWLRTDSRIWPLLEQADTDLTFDINGVAYAKLKHYVILIYGRLTAENSRVEWFMKVGNELARSARRMEATVENLMGPRVDFHGPHIEQEELADLRKEVATQVQARGAAKKANAPHWRLCQRRADHYADRETWKMCLDVVVPKADVRLGRVMKTGVVGETT